MFCSNCGKKLEDNVKHCPYCGAKVQGGLEEAGKSGEAKRKNGRLPVAFAALVVIAAVIFLGFKLFGGGRTLNPTDYVSVRVEGLDTEGKARLTFDKEKLLADIETKRTLTEREKEVIGVLVSDAAKDFSLSKSSGLSNGDEIRIESSLEKRLLKDYGITFKNDSVKVTVENLVAIREVALGDYVNFEYYGFEGGGHGGAYLDWEGLYAVAEEQIRKADSSASAEDFLQEELPQYLGAISIEPDYTEQLSNGDEVTATVSTELPEIGQYGLRFVGETISGTVEGLLPTENISLTEYLNCEFSGYSGAGYGAVTLDTERLTADLRELFREDQRGAYGKLTEAESEESETQENTEEETEAQEAERGDTEEEDRAQKAEEELEREAAWAADEIRSGWREYFTTELPEGNLSNGDTVTLTCTASQEPVYLSGIGCYLEGGSVEFSVEGLVPTETISLIEYLNCEVEGYSGVGYGSITLDTERLTRDLQELFRQDQRGAYETLMTDDAEEEAFAQEASYAAEEIRYNWRDFFTVSLSKEEALSNGDTISLTCAAEEGEESIYLEDIGCYLEGGLTEFEVEGLDIPQDVDLAEALTVEFSGICPNVRVDREINYDLPYVYDTSLYEMGSDETITAGNGDCYQGEITYDERELLEQGYRVTNNKYSYTISGLNSYQLSCASMEEEALASMTEALLTEGKRELVSESAGTLKELGISNRWILWDQMKFVPESGKFAFLEGDRAGNRLYLTYRSSFPVRQQNRRAEWKEIYYVTVFYNVEETPEGTLVWNEWDCEWYPDGDSAAEVVAEKIGEMGEEVSVRELSVEETAEEEEPISLDLEEVTVSAKAAKEPEPGEISGNAENLAAAVLVCDGHTYARYDTNLTWQLAKQFCEAAGGHLATVTSQKENAVLHKLLEEAPYGNYWLGATDEAWEGGWQWITGEEFAWTDWRDGQPDNSSGNDEEEENYLVTGSSSSYGWNDLYGSNAEGGFILEVEPADNTEQTGEEKDLADLIPTSVNHAGTMEYVQDSYGNEYFSSVYLDASENGAVCYDLKGEWTKLSAVLSTWPDAESGASFDIGIWGDGKLLFSRYDCRKTDAPEKFCLDVTGVQRLSVIAQNRGDYSNGYLFLQEAKLYGGEEEAKPSDGANKEENWQEALSELQNISAAEWEYWTDSVVVTDFAGEIHRDANRFLASKTGGGLWNLDGRYTSFAGRWTASRSAYCPQMSVGVEILADGEILFQEEALDVFRGGVPFEVDLTGKQVLEIRTWCNSEDTYTDLYAVLCDTFLMKQAEAEEAEAEGSEVGMAERAAEAVRSESLLPGPVFLEVPKLIEEQAAAILTCGNYRYYRFDQAMTWKQAAAFCQAAGGSLACPVKEEKNQAVWKLIDGGVWSEYWLGGQKYADTWEWSNGEPYTDYENWRSGQPDNYEDSEYLMSMDQSGVWNDLSDLDSTGFVMELQAVENLREESEIRLGSLERTEERYSEICDTMDQSGTLHLGSMELNATNEAAFTVALDGNYREFSGSISPYQLASDNVSMEIGIFGDGKCLCAWKDLRRNSQDLFFNLDVTGVNVLSVVTRNDGSTGNGYLYLVDPMLKPAENSVKEKVFRLKDLVAVDTISVSEDVKLFHDAYGLFHDRYLWMKTGEGASAVYNLDGAYTGFSGTITASRNVTELGVRMKVVILADGEELWSTEFEKREGPVKFEVDLTGKRVLEIQAETLTEGGSGEVFLTDDRLF